MRWRDYRRDVYKKHVRVKSQEINPARMPAGVQLDERISRERAKHKHIQTMEGQPQHERAIAVKRERGYTPGAPVEDAHKKKRKLVQKNGDVVKALAKQSRSEAMKKIAGIIPDILLGHTVETLVKGRAHLSVILLSMVNKQFRTALNGDLQLWYRLYLTWRGPIHATQPGPIRTPRGLVTLHPTIPRSLPNFRDLSPSIG